MSTNQPRHKIHTFRGLNHGKGIQVSWDFQELPKSQFPARSEHGGLPQTWGRLLLEYTVCVYIYCREKTGNGEPGEVQALMYLLRSRCTYSVSTNLEMSSVSSVTTPYCVCMHAFRASVKWRFRCESGAAELIQTLVWSEEATIKDYQPVDQNTSAQIAECLTLLLRTLIITRRWEVT